MLSTGLRRAAFWLVLAASGPALALYQSWTSIGPPGGWVESLVVDPVTPGILWAATDGGGVFRSTNRGATWVAVNAGMDDLSVQSLALDPVDPDVAYAGTSTAGVFMTTDAGASWSAASNGIPIGSGGPAVSALAVDPFSPSTLLAGTQGATPVFRSTDRGSSWLPASSGIPDFIRVHALAADTRVAGTSFAGTGSGLYRSTDGADTWTACDPDELGFYSIVTVELPSNQPGVVYAAEPNTVFKSSDGGDSFEPLPPLPRVPEEPPPPEPTPAITYKPLVYDVRSCSSCDDIDGKTFVDGELLVVASDGGLFVTGDDGAVWTAVAGSLPTREITRFRQSIPEPGELYVGSGGSGVFGQVDGGPWQPASAGLVATTVTAFAVADGVLLAGTRDAGVLRSPDRGETWDHANTGGLRDREVFALVVDPHLPRRVYAATYGGVFRSTDRGATWALLDAGLPDPVAFTVAVDPTDPAILYAAGNSVRRSTDGGATWESADGGIEGRQVRSLAVDPAAPASLYAGLYGAGVWKSTDRGATWASVSEGDGTGFLRNGVISVLVTDPGRPGTVYAAPDGRGVWRSNDGGGSWTPGNEGLVDPDTLSTATVHALVVDATSSERLWIAAGDSELFVLPGPRGCFESTDGGATWAPHPGGLDGVPLLSLVADPEDPARLYVGSAGRGAFRFAEPRPLHAPRRPRDRVAP